MSIGLSTFRIDRQMDKSSGVKEESKAVRNGQGVELGKTVDS